MYVSELVKNLENDVFVKSCTLQERDNWISLMNEVFGYTPPQSYGEDFAPLFTTEASLNNSALLWKDGVLASSAALYPQNLVLPGGELPVGIIGAVATRTQFQGKGYSSHLLDVVEESARRQGFAGIFLWSDQHEFYEKRGYKLSGIQEIWPLQVFQQQMQAQQRPQGSMQNQWDVSAVRALYEKHPLRTKRSDSYWKALENVKSCRRYQWVDGAGRVLAYAGVDRGKDLPGIIHEWGGEAQALRALVMELLSREPHLLWMTHPRLTDPVREVLVTQNAPCQIGGLALFKPLIESPSWDQLLSYVWFWGLDSL